MVTKCVVADGWVAGFTARLRATIIKNLHLTLHDVHLRFEQVHIPVHSRVGAHPSACVTQPVGGWCPGPAR